jgi:hypothetical protein
MPSHWSYHWVTCHTISSLAPCPVTCQTITSLATPFTMSEYVGSLITPHHADPSVAMLSAALKSTLRFHSLPSTGLDYTLTVNQRLLKLPRPAPANQHSHQNQPPYNWSLNNLQKGDNQEATHQCCTTHLAMDTTYTNHSNCSHS